MAEKKKMQLMPPKQRTQDDFVAAAGEVKSKLKGQGGDKVMLPWEADNVREDVIKSVNLRLPEPYILKLQYLSERTHKSQQVLIREALLPAIDSYIDSVNG